MLPLVNSRVIFLCIAIVIRWLTHNPVLVYFLATHTNTKSANIATIAYARKYPLPHISTWSLILPTSPKWKHGKDSKCLKYIL